MLEFEKQNNYVSKYHAYQPMTHTHKNTQIRVKSFFAHRLLNIDKQVQVLL